MNFDKDKISEFLKNKNFMIDMYVEKNKFVFDVIDELHKEFPFLCSNQEILDYYSKHIEKYNTIKKLSITVEYNSVHLPIICCLNKQTGDCLELKFLYLMNVLSLDVKIKTQQAKAAIHLFFEKKESNYYDNFKTARNTNYQVSESTVELYSDARLMNKEFNQLQIINPETKKNYPFLKNGYMNVIMTHLQRPENENKIYIQNLFFDKTEEQEQFDLFEINNLINENKDEFKKFIKNENNQFVKKFQDNIEISALLNDKNLTKDSEIFLSHIDLFQGVLSDDKLILAKNKKRFSFKNFFK